MNKQTEDLLDLASKGSTVARSIVPPGVRVGDIISNGWAGNKNPMKLLMYLGCSGGVLRGVNIEGKTCAPYKRDNRCAIVLSRDTPNLWAAWEELDRALKLQPEYIGEVENDPR